MTIHNQPSIRFGITVKVPTKIHEDRALAQKANEALSKYYGVPVYEDNKTAVVLEADQDTHTYWVFDGPKDQQRTHLEELKARLKKLKTRLKIVKSRPKTRLFREWSKRSETLIQKLSRLQKRTELEGILNHHDGLDLDRSREVQVVPHRIDPQHDRSLRGAIDSLNAWIYPGSPFQPMRPRKKDFSA